MPRVWLTIGMNYEMGLNGAPTEIGDQQEPTATLRSGCPSNRTNSRSVTEPSGEPFVGIDRISLSFPISSFEQAPESWSSKKVLDPGRLSETRFWGSTLRVREAGVFVGVMEQGVTGRTRGKVECNPSRIWAPHGWELVSVEVAHQALGYVLPVVQEFMTPLAEIDIWRVRRLDVARDFEGVSRPDDTIRAVAPLPRNWARTNKLYTDPRKHGAQTLEAGSGAGTVRLYDKHVETGGSAPKGTLRWEAQCRDGWLDHYGNIRLVRDLHLDSCLAMARNRWLWSNMGVVVGGMTSVYDVVEAARMTWREQGGFLGWLWAQALGRSPDVSRETKARYRQLQRDLGVVVDSGKLEVREGASTRRLDWETGREVRCDA